MGDGSQHTPSVQYKDRADRGLAEFVEGESLVEMIHKDLMAKRISIEGCRDIIQYLRDQDAPTRHRLEGILAIKGERVGDAANRVARISAHMKTKNKVRNGSV